MDAGAPLAATLSFISCSHIYDLVPLMACVQPDQTYLQMYFYCTFTLCIVNQLICAFPCWFVGQLIITGFLNFTHGFKSADILLSVTFLLKVTGFLFGNMVICLSPCETVWAACFMWAACITTINTALSQTKWILWSSEIEHILPKARGNCATYSGVIILSRNTVWNCSPLFYGRVTLWIHIVFLSFLHPGEFYFKTTLEASAKKKKRRKKQTVYLCADVCSHIVCMLLVLATMSFLQ